MFSSTFSPTVQVGFVILFCTPLVAGAYWKKVLTWDGCAVAFAVGMLIGVFGGILWLLLLLILLLSSFAATRYKFSLKIAKGVQEGKHGERGARNVFVHAAVPSVLAVLNFFVVSFPRFEPETTTILFITAISAAGADAIASELGVLSDRVVLITTFKKVKAGTNGGISVLGTFAALAAAAYISIIGGFILALDYPRILNNTGILLVPLLTGFLGCNIDSVIGATLERRGYVGKHSNNLISITLSVIVALVVLSWVRI